MAEAIEDHCGKSIARGDGARSRLTSWVGIVSLNTEHRPAAAYGIPTALGPKWVERQRNPPADSQSITSERAR